MKKTIIVLSVALATQIFAGDKNLTLPTKKSFESQSLTPKELEKTCNEGDFRSCSNLGILYKRGRQGIKEDKQKAIELFKKSCEGGNIYGCENLGFIYYESKKEEEYKKAAPFFKDVCYKSEAPACVALGYMYFMGLGVEKNTTKTEKLYDKACKLGFKKGCHAHKLLTEEMKEEEK